MFREDSVWYRMYFRGSSNIKAVRAPYDFQQAPVNVGVLSRLHGLSSVCRSLQLRPVPISGMSHISSGWWLSNRTELVLLCIYQALTYYQSTDVVLLGAVALHNVNNEILYTLVTTIDPWSTKCHWGLEGDIQNIRKWFWHQKAARQQVLTNLSVYRIL